MKLSLGGPGVWRCAACLIGLLTTACARKAPGPEECEDFALRALGIRDQQLLAVPAVKDQFDQVVIKCLTTPYDKQLIQCVQAGVSTRACLLEFQAREQRREHPIDR